jgi:nitrogen regulatory protein P-II 1
MKELKAYVRPTYLDAIIRHLEEAGARDITVIRVDAFGALTNGEFERQRLLRSYEEKYSRVAKLEIICADQDALRFMQIIREYGHTGESGDGRVFLTNVEAALNIRTGQEDEAAL